MFVLAAPLVTACCENLSSLPRLPRGTPKPAESFLNTKEFEEATSERTTGFIFTARSVGSPAPGGRKGATGMRPPPPPAPPLNAIRFVLFSPLHMPPGCHPHPAPSQKAQLP